jgi:protocatechuate 3,4-dioxygenase, alpha subunit
MSIDRMIPNGSQTVGPFFHIGLGHLVSKAPANMSTSDMIEFRGKVLDRDGEPVPDAMLEFWCADPSVDNSGANSPPSGQPIGFHRVATDLYGSFSLSLTKPGLTPSGDGRVQAPHLLVLVFARGLLRHLITRVYFENESANDSDPVLLEVPTERRHTLVASSDATRRDAFRWNVILQGNNETVFFAW